MRFIDGRYRRSGRPMLRASRSVVLGVLLGALATPVFADTTAKQQMQGLDEQVQEIKSDVLAIAAELSLLEEKLLFPSNTQVAVFVSLAEGDAVRVDSVEIEIDGQPVAHHIYSFKELEALQKGGVQRIYTGNLATGAHQIGVSVAGKLPGGSDFDDSRSFEFRKDVAPKLVEITLGADAGDGRIRLASGLGDG